MQSLGQDSLDSNKKNETVLLLMSGGVDSSMCAHILCQQGYDVTGLYMHNWNHQEETQDEIASGTTYPNDTQYLKESTPSSSLSSEESNNILATRTARIRPKICTSDRDWADVQAVCEQLGIPARRLDFSRQYWNQVFEVMLQEYERGRTPNPDVTCNKEIKFGELIEWCDRNGGLGKDRRQDFVSSSPTKAGWDYLATGHYARVEQDPATGRARLLRAADSNKDQTYYLSTLSERVLRHALFPLAQYDKPTVKRMAMTTGAQQIVIAATKKESMGICFVGQRRRFGDFLREYLDSKPGPVKVDGLDGPTIGEHKGVFQYTVGQASGVTNGHQKWVVLRADIPSNTLVVVEGTQNKKLFSPGLIAESWHWIAGEPPKSLQQHSESRSNPSPSNVERFPYTAQIRHRQVPQPCSIEVVKDSEQSPEGPLYQVLFKDLQRAIAPGQQIVLYDKDECLGGAVIQSGLPLSLPPRE
ncbi:hypothetical protein BGZ83_002303 [Gryganskiella cystojenkinii]|nr:hypothetical protein BGZ83_002303 [Gryganskiella cystojenkinii]